MPGLSYAMVVHVVSILKPKARKGQFLFTPTFTASCKCTSYLIASPQEAVMIIHRAW
jgi:hypothetical protein